jgi:DNA polymerase III epsilon subunit-like protein
MVDIETLGLEVGAAILSIGAVRFDRDGVGDQFYGSISLESCQEARLTIDAETLVWWLDQDQEALEQLTGGQDLHTVLSAFVAWYGDADEVWANSPSFDCEMLERAGEHVGIEMPWAFQEERDYRTLTSLPGTGEVQVEQDGTEHHALDDAEHQARVAAATLRKLAGGDDA